MQCFMEFSDMPILQYAISSSVLAKSQDSRVDEAHGIAGCSTLLIPTSRVKFPDA